jgi:hypothetical protein
MNFLELKSNGILRISFILSIALVILIYFIYRPILWPFGTEAAGCLISVLMLTATLVLLWKFKERFITSLQKRNVAIGLCVGLLWTIEISINNFIRPDVPLRDNIDNIFWTVIAILIYVNAVREAFHTNSFSDGLKSGFWSGISSGAVACLTALALIVFGMKYILLDPLNLREWADVKDTATSKEMSVYFAYQSFTGAIMHLFILGAFMGLILGTIAGLSGKILIIIKKLTSRVK